MPSPRLLRCRIDRKLGAGSNFTTDEGVAPSTWPGSPLRLDFLLQRGTALLAAAEIDTFALITVYVKAEDYTGAVLASESNAVFDSGVTAETWADGSAQHAFVEFDAADTELEIPDGDDSKKYGLIVEIDGVTVARGTLEVFRDGIPVDDNPTFTGNLIPVGAIYDEFGEYVLATLAAGNSYQWTKKANDLQIANGDQLIETDGAIFIAQTDTVSLSGTPSQLVTAILRNTGTLTPDQINALYLRRNGSNSMLADLPITTERSGVTVGTVITQPEDGEGAEARHKMVTPAGETYVGMEPLYHQGWLTLESKTNDKGIVLVGKTGDVRKEIARFDARGFFLKNESDNKFYKLNLINIDGVPTLQVGDAGSGED